MYYVQIPASWANRIPSRVIMAGVKKNLTVYPTALLAGLTLRLNPLWKSRWNTNKCDGKKNWYNFVFLLNLRIDSLAPSWVWKYPRGIDKLPRAKFFRAKPTFHSPEVRSKKVVRPTDRPIDWPTDRPWESNRSTLVFPLNFVSQKSNRFMLAFPQIFDFEQY